MCDAIDVVLVKLSRHHGNHSPRPKCGREGDDAQTEQSRVFIAYALCALSCEWTASPRILPFP